MSLHCSFSLSLSLFLRHDFNNSYLFHNEIQKHNLLRTLLAIKEILLPNNLNIQSGSLTYCKIYVHIIFSLRMSNMNSREVTIQKMSVLNLISNGSREVRDQVRIPRAKMSVFIILVYQFYDLYVFFFFLILCKDGYLKERLNRIML